MPNEQLLKSITYKTFRNGTGGSQGRVVEKIKLATTLTQSHCGWADDSYVPSPPNSLDFIVAGYPIC